MLFKLLAKLLFKASIPLILIAGLFTYGLYLKGGDPAAMWKSAGSGFMAQAGKLVAGVKSDASQAAEKVGNAASGGLQGLDSSAGGMTQVFTWKDAEGVTHYSTEAPEGVQTRKMSVNPDQNVLAPIKIAKPVIAKHKESEGTAEAVATDARPRRDERASDSGTQDQGYSDPALQELADQFGGDLPGVVGQVLSTQSKDGSAGLNPNQLLKMLQAK